MPSLEQTILLGTERMTAPPDAPHPSLLATWQTLDWANNRDDAALAAIAFTGTAAAAGQGPRTDVPASTVAAAETRPLASPNALAVLRQLFEPELKPVLAEWLQTCADRGQIVPPFFLPTLLNRCREGREAALLAQAVGHRAAWLVQLNPGWATAMPASTSAEDRESWETGTPAERLAWFAAARRQDAAAARVQLETGWKNEAPEFRIAVLEIIAAEPTLADETFLNAALHDRRKEARTLAQHALARLPESALAIRLRERAPSLLRLQKGLLSRKLEIDLPAAFDPSWKEDGIDEKPPAGTGEKAWWIRQMIALLPVATWMNAFDLSAEKLIKLAAEGDWADLLLGAWADASVLHQEAELAERLIPALRGRPDALAAGSRFPQHLLALAAICPMERRWHLATHADQHAWSLLPLLDPAPTPELARCLLGHIARDIREGYNPGGSPQAALAASKLPPALREEAARLLERDNGSSKPAEAFLRTLDLRAALHAAFSTP